MFDNNTMKRWLSAERSQDDSAAETALFEVFERLSDPLPSSGFAAAVLQRIEGARIAPAMPLPMRWAIAAAMIAAALSLALTPLALRSMSGLFELGFSVEMISAGLVAASSALVDWLELWRSVAELDRVLLGIVSKPLIAAPLVVILGICLAALSLFSRLTASERSGDYV